MNNVRFPHPDVPGFAQITAAIARDQLQEINLTARRLQRELADEMGVLRRMRREIANDMRPFQQSNDLRSPQYMQYLEEARSVQEQIDALQDRNTTLEHIRLESAERRRLIGRMLYGAEAYDGDRLMELMDPIPSMTRTLLRHDASTPSSSSPSAPATAAHSQQYPPTPPHRVDPRLHVSARQSDLAAVQAAPRPPAPPPIVPPRTQAPPPHVAQRRQRVEDDGNDYEPVLFDVDAALREAQEENDRDARGGGNGGMSAAGEFAVSCKRCKTCGK